MSPTEEVWWKKWDNAAKAMDFMNKGVELRFGDQKRQWFSRAKGRTLLVAVGTGLDLQYFPQELQLVGIDISWKMLEKAKEKKESSDSKTQLVRADAELLGFADHAFDTVVASCTFCSVPNPVKGLQEVRRVLKPGGKLIMFEHVRSNIFWMGPMMDWMTKVTRRFGPDLNRRTRANILQAGFQLTREINLYLDMVKFFEAVNQKKCPN